MNNDYIFYGKTERKFEPIKEEESLLSKLKRTVEFDIIKRSLLDQEYELIPPTVTKLVMTSEDKLHVCMEIDLLLHEYDYFSNAEEDEIVVPIDDKLVYVFDGRIACVEVGEVEDYEYSYYLLTVYDSWMKGCSVSSLGDVTDSPRRNDISVYEQDVDKQVLVDDMSAYCFDSLMLVDESLRKVLTPGYTRQKSEEVEIEILKIKLRDFYEGKVLDVSFADLSSVHGQGTYLPTTLSGEEWVLQQVKQLVNEEFLDCKLGVVTNDCDFSRKFDPQLTTEVFFSRDPLHPLYWDTNPSFSMDGDSKWHFRVLCNEIRSEIEEVDNYHNYSPEYQRKLFHSLLKDSLDVREFSYNPIDPSKVMSLLRVNSSVYSVLELNSLTFSSIDVLEVEPCSMHIVNREVARTAGKSWYKIILQDQLTVLMIPMKLWVHSNYYRKSRGSNLIRMDIPLGYSGSVGMEFSDAPYNPYLRWYLCAGASLKLRMLETWGRGDHFSIQDSVDKLKTNFDYRSYDNFFPKTILPFLPAFVVDRLLQLLKNSYTGITIAPAPTDRGVETYKLVKMVNDFNRTHFHNAVIFNRVEKRSSDLASLRGRLEDPLNMDILHLSSSSCSSFSSDEE